MHCYCTAGEGAGDTFASAHGRGSIQPESNLLMGFLYSFSLNALDSFMWGFLQEKVLSEKPTIDKLKTANAQEVTDMSAGSSSI